MLEETQCGRSVFQKWEGVALETVFEESKPFGDHHLVEVVTDADWGSKCFSERKSLSSYCIYVNGNLCRSGNRVQKSISLSSAESELCGSLLGVSEALFVASAIRFMCGIDAKDTEKVKVVHYVDNSAARAIIQKEGLGKSRHVELGWLWIQRAHKDKKFETKPISTALCPADLATKPHPRRRAKLLCYLVGMFDSEHQELFGVEEFAKREVKVRRIQSRGHANARVLQLVALLTQALVGEACSSVELQNTYTCATKLHRRWMTFYSTHSFFAFFSCGVKKMKVADMSYDAVCWISVLACHSHVCSQSVWPCVGKFWQPL